MGGQLLYLTGMVDKRTLEKFEKEAKEAGRESWYLSWALDSTPQERAKVSRRIGRKGLVTRGQLKILALITIYPLVYRPIILGNLRERRSKSDGPTLRPTSDDTPSSTPQATSLTFPT